MMIEKYLNKLSKYFTLIFNILITQIKQNECTKLKDNILLYKLLSKAPKCFDRVFEYPWVLKNIDIKEGRLLDVGSTVGNMLKELIPENIEIHTINTEKKESNNKTIQYIGDIRKTEYKDNYFDAVTCISTLEHIGVEGRYHSDNDPDGDLKAMIEMHRILKTGGKLYITIPYGIRDVLPINKLYNKNRINVLTKDFRIIKEEYLKYNSKYSLWLNSSEQEAGMTDWLKDRWYSLAFFILEK